MHQGRHEADAYRRIELITSRQRRRRWTDEEKAALVAESLLPGANVSEVARRAGVNRGLLQTWRRAADREVAPESVRFIPVRIEETPAPLRVERPPRDAYGEVPLGAAPSSGVGTVEIEGGGMRVRFSGPVDVAVLQLVLGRVGRRA
jgi:transposase